MTAWQAYTWVKKLSANARCHCSHADRRCSLPTHFVRQASKPFPVEIKQREVGARLGKCPRDRRADATGCTSDADHLSRQFLRRHCSAPSLVLRDTSSVMRGQPCAQDPLWEIDRLMPTERSSFPPPSIQVAELGPGGLE